MDELLHNLNGLNEFTKSTVVALAVMCALVTWPIIGSWVRAGLLCPGYIFGGLIANWLLVNTGRHFVDRQTDVMVAASAGIIVALLIQLAIIAALSAILAYRRPVAERTPSATA